MLKFKEGNDNCREMYTNDDFVFDGPGPIGSSKKMENGSKKVGSASGDGALGSGKRVCSMPSNTVQPTPRVYSFPLIYCSPNGKHVS